MSDLTRPVIELILQLILRDKGYKRLFIDKRLVKVFNALSADHLLQLYLL